MKSNDSNTSFNNISISDKFLKLILGVFITLITAAQLWMFTEIRDFPVTFAATTYVDKQIEKEHIVICDIKREVNLELIELKEDIRNSLNILDKRSERMYINGKNTEHKVDTLIMELANFSTIRNNKTKE